ncbi:MAG: glycosyltransferase family 39 protein [Anaerolineaceae bacterium]|nr:glycosyltransferase family 39 protein [Anaerolineaceae bacterium]
MLILVAMGAGETFLKLLLRKEIEDKMENLVISLLLGFGIVMILVMIQGFLNAFSPLVTWVGIGLMGLLFVVPNLKKWFLTIKEVLKKFFSLWDNEIFLPYLSLFFGIFLILLIPSWLIAHSPPMRYDEMTYHLTAPLLYLERGGIVIYPEGGMTVWMHYAEMLFTLAIQTAGLTLTRVFHLLFGLLSIAITYLFGQRLANKKTGIIAALLLFSIPVVGYESATAYIDFFVTAYTTAVGFTMLLFWQEQNPRWLLVAGFLGGIGLGIKLTGGPVIAAMVGIFIIIAIFQRFSVKKYLWIGGMILLIVVLAMPWFIRDTFWTGDPFYPYGNMFLQRLSQTSVTGGTSQQISFLSNLAKFVTYPVDITFNSYRYYHEAPGGMASVLPLMAIPLFLFSAQCKKQEKIIALILLGTSIVSVWIMLLINIALIRYALPVFPWLAVNAAMNINIVSDYFSSKRGRVGGSFLLMIGLLYVFSTRLPLIARLYDNLPQRLPVNYFLGLESKEEYLSRNLAVYDAFQFIDVQENGPHRVLSIGNEFRLYTKSRIDGIYDVAEAHKIVSSADNYDSLAKALEAAGYDFILVNQREIDFRLWKYSEPYPILHNSEFINLYGKLKFAKNGIFVYAFVPSKIPFPEAENLLLNPGFEDLIHEYNIKDWEEVGLIERSVNAIEGEYSLKLFAPLSEQGLNYIYQKVAVDQNQIYTLGYWVKSDENAVFLMQIRWLDGHSNIISKEEEWKNVSQDWRWISMFSQAPVGAKYAEIYASLGGSVNALVDEICFSAGQQCPPP